MRKLYLTILVFLIGVIIWAGFYNKNTNITKTDYALDTVIKISAQGKNAKNAVTEAFEFIKTSENYLSAYKDDSEVSKINKSKAYEGNGDVLRIISDAYIYSEKTGGYFDITIKPVVDLWHIKNNTDYVPSDDEISSSLSSVGYKNIVLESNGVKLKNGASIDLGGIAKGYCANKTAEIMKKNGVKESIIDLGGNVYVIGNREFKVGIQNPDGERGEYFGICRVKNTSVVTSGAYERYFVKDGKMYHHILNPLNGKCADAGVKSVTVIGGDSQKCDAFSTAVFAMGAKEGIKVLQNESDLDYVIVDNENNVYVSENLDFEITDENYIRKGE